MHAAPSLLPSLRDFWKTCTALFLGALALFLLEINHPAGVNFDEFHYVPSAKQFLALQENQNWEHPPLGKELMAIGIAIFGDQPLGWRFMSALFGAFTLVGMYGLALSLFRSQRTALWVAALTLLNHLLYVQARIGMLDTFMMAFLLPALACWIEGSREACSSRSRTQVLYLGGILFGLAIACKWSAIVPWLGLLALSGIALLLKSWGAHFTYKSHPHFSENDSDFWTDLGWGDLTWKKALFTLFILPFFVYSLTFLPFLFFNRAPAYTLWDLVLMQPKMWDGQLRVVTQHPYMSSWWGWPWLMRPIWYAFEKDPLDPGWVRGVLLIGNPWIMWTGIPAILFCGWAWVRDRSRQAFWILLLYGLFYLPWAVIPRKITFYYYYYPAGMTLSLAAAFALSRLPWPKAHPRLAPDLPRWLYLAIAFLVFVYFFPVLSGMRIPADSFTRWTWFRSWI